MSKPWWPKCMCWCNQGELAPMAANAVRSPLQRSQRRKGTRARAGKQAMGAAGTAGKFSFPDLDATAGTFATPATIAFSSAFVSPSWDVRRPPINLPHAHPKSTRSQKQSESAEAKPYPGQPAK
jgi:hypothetical protein